MGGRHVDLTGGSYVGGARWTRDPDPWTRVPRVDWQGNAQATINKLYNIRQGNIPNYL